MAKCNQLTVLPFKWLNGLCMQTLHVCIYISSIAAAAAAARCDGRRRCSAERKAKIYDDDNAAEDDVPSLKP